MFLQKKIEKSKFGNINKILEARAFCPRREASHSVPSFGFQRLESTQSPWNFQVERDAEAIRSISAEELAGELARSH